MLIQPFKIDMLQYVINLKAAYQQMLSNLFMIPFNLTLLFIDYGKKT